MIRFHYISPSVLPSRTANSVHVAFQCEALVHAGAHVTLYAKRSVAADAALPAAMRAAYGVDVTGMRLVSFYSASSRADTLRIAAVAVNDLRRGSRPDAILSRNLYAAFYLAVVERRPLIFETHQLEIGVRKFMQRAIMTRPWVRTVVISDRLASCLVEHHGVVPAHILVLHDAAPEGMTPLPVAQRRGTLQQITDVGDRQWEAVAGYFGHLYPGRGIEIIESIARDRPNILFLVFGGNQGDVAARCANNSFPNLRYLGHVPHPVARIAMCAVDVLLMPYQESVSIGVRGHDTARWMSPMKMFEYLASGVPLISSDLPALREVLTDGVNSVLVSAADTIAWTAALDRIIADPVWAQAIAVRGHKDYLTKHTWKRRAERLLDVAAGRD